MKGARRYFMKNIIKSNDHDYFNGPLCEPFDNSVLEKYHFRELIKYCEDNNLSFEELSDEELKKFEKSDLPYETYLLHKMGYPLHGFNPSNRIFLFIRRNDITAEKVKTITYEELASIRAVGYTIIKEFVDVLNAAKVEHSIILPLSREEKKKIKENEKQVLIQTLMELLLSTSNIDVINNSIDKLIFEDYKSYIETLTTKKIEDKIKKIQSKLNK